MSTHINTEADLDRGIAALIAADPRFAAVLERGGRPPLRRRDGGYAGLAQIIVSQQVSVASAAAIYGRLVAIAEPFDHTAVLRARRDKLLRVGLSNAKIKTLKAIAKAIDKRHIDLDALADLPRRRRARPLTRCTASARGPRTSICSPASAMPTPGRRAILRCRRRRAPHSHFRRVRPPERWALSRKAGALSRSRGAAAVDLLSRREEARRRATGDRGAEACGENGSERQRGKDGR